MSDAMEDMRDVAKLVCPHCDVEMNRHAAKVVEPRNAEDMADMDPGLGGIVLDVHCCPECGGIGSQRQRKTVSD